MWSYKELFFHVLSHDRTWDVVLYFLHLLHCRHCNCVAFLQLWLCLHVTRTLIPAHGSPKSIIWMFGESIFLSFLLLLTWCFHIRYFNAFNIYIEFYRFPVRRFDVWKITRAAFLVRQPWPAECWKALVVYTHMVRRRGLDRNWTCDNGD